MYVPASLVFGRLAQSQLADELSLPCFGVRRIVASKVVHVRVYKLLQHATCLQLRGEDFSAGTRESVPHLTKVWVP
jgi:hypothetical protein